MADKGDPLLVAALRAEHAAIFAYGSIGAKLSGAARQLATETEAAHRQRRDSLLLRLAAKGVQTPTADPAYALPFPITDQGAALRLAIAMEEATGRVWRPALAATVGEERKLTLDAVTDCALRATRFRRAAGVNPATVALPGAPASGS